MRPSLNPFICFIVTVFAMSYTYGQADTTKLGELNLQQLLSVKITTASKTLQALELVPAAVVVITKEQIQSRGYRSLLDVLHDLPDVKVDDKIYSGVRNSVTIRGVQGAHNFLLLMNGVVISSLSGEAMPIMENYPVHLAEQIEVLYGPASALYGSNAVSGVINIITKTANKKDLLIEASSVAGTYGYTNTTLFVSKKLNKYVSITAAGQYFYDKGPDYSKLYKSDSLFDMTSHQTGVFNTIFGPMKPATPVKPEYEMPMEAYNIYAGINTEYFAFNFFRNSCKLPTGFENNPNNTVYNKDVFMTQNITMANALHKRKFNNVTFNTTLMASEYHLDPYSNYRNLYTNMERAYKYATTSLVKAEEQVDIKATKNLQLSAGVGYEIYHSVPQSADLASPVNTNNYITGNIVGSQSYYKPDGLPAQFYFLKYNNLGSFLQAQYDVNAKLHMTVGARYDRNSRYGSSLNPRAVIVYKPVKHTIIKLLSGSAYLAPSPTSAYVQYGSFETLDSGHTYHSYFLHLPNPGLKPIRSYNTELNISQQLSDNIILTLNAYYTRLKGLYAFADDNETTKLYNNVFNGIPVDYVEVIVNRNRQENYGGNLQLNWKRHFGIVRLNAWASLSYVNGRIHDHANPLKTKHIEVDFIAPVMARMGADVKIGKFSCSPRLLIMGRQNLPGIDDASGDIVKRQTIAGYQLLNVAIRYKVSRQLSVFANATNALDQRYRNVSYNMDLTKKETELFYGQHQDPVRIMGGLSVSFN
jgi:outer membrane receptor protein involved in Fe transport